MLEMEFETTMTRDEMISLLVFDRLEHRDDFGRYLHLQGVLENGFRGFRNLSDQELLSELRRLGLETRPGVRSDDEIDDFADDCRFDSSLSAGHAFSVFPASEHFR